MLRDANKTIRVRVVEGQDGYLTIKNGTIGYSRLESGYSLPEQDAREMLSHFCDAIVSKIRYRLTACGRFWEVDEFLDDNEGLIVAEIELAQEAEVFELPHWIDKEVTKEERYYNSRLSVHPYKIWKH